MWDFRTFQPFVPFQVEERLQREQGLDRDWSQVLDKEGNNSSLLTTKLFHYKFGRCNQNTLRVLTDGMSDAVFEDKGVPDAFALTKMHRITASKEEHLGKVFVFPYTGSAGDLVPESPAVIRELELSKLLSRSGGNFCEWDEESDASATLRFHCGFQHDGRTEAEKEAQRRHLQAAVRQLFGAAEPEQWAEEEPAAGGEPPAEVPPAEVPAAA